MSFAVYRRSCLFIGSLDKAEHLATALVKPVLQVLYPVLFLSLYVCLMRVHDGICGQPLNFVMDIHIKWHYLSPSERVTIIKNICCISTCSQEAYSRYPV